MPAANCSNCGARLAKDTRFCPECGVRTAAANDSTAIDEVPPDETGQVPVHKVAAAPRYFGVAPPLALFTLAAAALVAAIVVLVGGNTIAGALLLVAAALFSTLFVAAARRPPETALVRFSRRTVERMRDRAGFAVEAVSVHSNARRELLRLRHELSDLVAERAEAARTLGEAVYRGADDQAEAARNRMSEIDQGLADKETQMRTVAAAANQRIQRAQLQVQPTAIVEPPQIPEPMPVPSEPPQPVTVPEPSPVPSEPPTPVPSPEPMPEPSPPDLEPPPQAG
jgi:zinc-ribbon domain